MFHSTKCAPHILKHGPQTNKQSPKQNKTKKKENQNEKNPKKHLRKTEKNLFEISKKWMTSYHFRTLNRSPNRSVTDEISESLFLGNKKRFLIYRNIEKNIFFGFEDVCAKGPPNRAIFVV